MVTEMKYRPSIPDPRKPALRLLAAAGGTGGHIFPGLAVAEVAKREKGAQVLFVGGAEGVEKEVIPRHGFPLHTIPACSLRGKDWTGTLLALWAAAKSLGHSRAIVREFQPDLIIGIGGYASGPTVVAGWREGIPCVLLEPNAKPGLTNKLLGHIATRICVGFPETMSYFPAHKVVCTGNPVRASFKPAPTAATSSKAKEPFTLLAFGGSAGAHRLNQALPAALPYSGEMVQQIRIVHQTGKKEQEQVTAAYSRAGVNAKVFSFIHNMEEVYHQAHLVVCRSGATTVAELTVLGVPAILVPYPYAADDHQRANAEVLVRAGAAVMILDRELSGERLGREIRTLASDPQRLAAMAKAAAALGRPQAADDVIKECVGLLCGQCLI
jgi:UDP-N-acetylglucosamine--N-acetylmuramyl-(pentapeptide) pyrophosphoryl-undecaprenol N-acetylglucosamine transferase